MQTIYSEAEEYITVLDICILSTTSIHCVRINFARIMILPVLSYHELYCEQNSTNNEYVKLIYLNYIPLLSRLIFQCQPLVHQSISQMIQNGNDLVE